MSGSNGANPGHRPKSYRSTWNRPPGRIVSAFWRARFADLRRGDHAPYPVRAVIGDDLTCCTSTWPRSADPFGTPSRSPSAKCPIGRRTATFGHLDGWAGEHLPHMFAWKVVARFDITPPHAAPLSALDFCSWPLLGRVRCFAGPVSSLPPMTQDRADSHFISDGSW